jgi:hypothetical protein
MHDFPRLVFTFEKGTLIRFPCCVLRINGLGFGQIFEPGSCFENHPDSFAEFAPAIVTLD